MTDAEFQAIEDQIDVLKRRASRAPDPTDEQVIADWEAAYAMPVVKFTDRKVRDAAMLAVARKHKLVP